MTTIRSTRSNASADARRDFDDFNEDVELARMRQAMAEGQWRVAAELAANLDEHLSRGGSLPVAWLGPGCSQTSDDHEARHVDALERAAKMTPAQRDAATAGYVEIVLA